MRPRASLLWPAKQAVHFVDSGLLGLQSARLGLFLPSRHPDCYDMHSGMHQMLKSASVVVTILASSWLAGCAARSTAQIPAIPSASASTPAATSSSSSAEKTAGKPAQNGAAGSTESKAAKTPDEQRETLDGDLQTSLAKFDAMLLKEQQEVAAKRAEHGGGAGGAGGGAGGEGDGSGSSAGGTASAGGSTKSTSDARAEKGRQDRNGSKDKATGSSKSDRAGGGRDVATAPEGTTAQDQGDASRVPADVGDGRNDDVVARQIREAAMAEEDPKIRERLWDEYRRYKRGES